MHAHTLGSDASAILIASLRWPQRAPAAGPLGPRLGSYAHHRVPRGVTLSVPRAGRQQGCAGSGAHAVPLRVAFIVVQLRSVAPLAVERPAQCLASCYATPPAP